MSRIITIIVCFLLTCVIGFSQTRKTPVNSVSPKQSPSTVRTKVLENEWREISTALEAEDWERVSSLSASVLKTLKDEDEARRLARLRYFYLFSLAGKVAQGRMTVTELQNIAQAFVGQEFVMLDRNVLSNCDKSLNYICPVRDDKNALRVTATNKAFTTIHSFEYVKLLQPFNFAENSLKNVFVGGKLKKVEINPKPEKVWIMRLFFEDGWVQIVDKK